MLILVSLVFPALMIAAGLIDLSSFTIPNRITLALVATWPMAAFCMQMPWLQMALALVAAFLVLCVGFVLFAKRMLGGGDAKLLAASVLWVGTGALWPFLTTTALAGAVLAVVLLTFRKLPLPTMALSHDWVMALHTRHRDMPYGVAIAVGGLFVWPQTHFALALG